MKKRYGQPLLDQQIPLGSSDKNTQETGYLWFFLAIVLIMGFMILSHLGIAS